MGADQPDQRAAALVLRNFISSPYMTELRTRQQLGYIVSGFTTRRENLLHAGFLIQSADYTPDQLKERSETFINTLPQLWSEVSPEQFETLVEAAKSEVAEKDKSIAERASTYFTRAFEHGLDWDRQKDSLAALDTLTTDQVAKVLTDMIDPEVRQVRTVLAYAAQHELPET